MFSHLHLLGLGLVCSETFEAKVDHCWNGNSFLKSQEPGTFSRKGAVTSATFERTGREDESCCWCWFAKVNLRRKDIVILLMEEILHHLEGTNPFKQRDNWITYLSTGAGFLPSTVV